MEDEAIGWTQKTEGGSRQHLAVALFSRAVYSECGRRVSFISFRSNDIYWFSVLDVTITELVRSGWSADGSFISSWVSCSSVTRVADWHLFQILEWKYMKLRSPCYSHFPHPHMYRKTHSDMTLVLLILGPEKRCWQTFIYHFKYIHIIYIYLVKAVPQRWPFLSKCSHIT